MVCGDEEIFNLGGQFVDMIESGAKGSQNLIKSTQQYRQTLNTDIETVSLRATTSLNSYISSHNKVKVCGADIYHNTVVLQSVFIKNNYVCYKTTNVQSWIFALCPLSFCFQSICSTCLLNDNINKAYLIRCNQCFINFKATCTINFWFIFT